MALTVQGKDFDRGLPQLYGRSMRGCSVFLHDDPGDRDPKIFDGTTTTHAGGRHGSHLLVPAIPPKSASAAPSARPAAALRCGNGGYQVTCVTASETDPAPAPAKRYGWGVDDIALIPLAAAAFLLVTLLRWAWRLLVLVLDEVFALLMQVVRSVLFVLRMGGDALVGLLRLVIRILPVGGLRRSAWREAVARAWTWLRARISYKVFEAWLHHLFEDGMAWTFRVCRRLSPTGALLVIVLSAVWIPASFSLATAAHAYLIAQAANLPPWMQSLHVVATLLAKSKLLMLPAYPASWPQAKKHPIVRAIFRTIRFVAGLAPVRKAAQRYGDVDGVATRRADAFLRFSENAGLSGAVRAMGAAIGGAVSRIANAIRAVFGAVARAIAITPWLGPMLRGYAEQYAKDAAVPREKLSARVREFLDRWRIKFSPAYYEAKEKEKEAAAAAPPPSAQPPG